MIYLGATAPSAIYLGASPVSAIYLGDVKIWPVGTTGPTYELYDDFERTSIGSAWTGSGAIISSGQLKKSRVTGSADLWSAVQLAADDLDVTVTIGDVTDAVQRASLLVGSSAAYIYFDFCHNDWILGAYDGTTWTNLTTGGAIAWTKGDKLRLTRVGSLIVVYRNGVQLASVTSSVAIGAAYRRIGFTVRSWAGFFTPTYYGPLIDAVAVNPH